MLNDHRLYVGLMSGTSIDGVDAVLAQFSTEEITVRGHIHLSMPRPLKNLLGQIVSAQSATLGDLLKADLGIADLYVTATRELLASGGICPEKVAAIGSHGQTICHRPDLGTTLQIGDGSRIAEGTGIPTVADFRRADMAVHGQGAPLAPAFHAAALRSAEENRALLNLGGIANVTWLPSDPDAEVIGFDTGPANTLLDYWVAKHLETDFDRNGDWAAGGVIHTGLLEHMLQDPFVAAPPPKSTGREYFNADWLLAALQQTPHINAQDVQTTLAEFTAISVAQNVQAFCGTSGCVYACGGGACNAYLMDRIAKHLPGFELRTTDDLGIPVQLMEAVAFAWLARQTLNGLPGNLPSVTGAARPVVLGGLYSAPRPDSIARTFD